MRDGEYAPCGEPAVGVAVHEGSSLYPACAKHEWRPVGELTAERESTGKTADGDSSPAACDPDPAVLAEAMRQEADRRLSRDQEAAQAAGHTADAFRQHSAWHNAADWLEAASGQRDVTRWP